MSLALIVVIGACAALLWPLITAMWTVERQCSSRSAGQSQLSTLLSRADNPVGFWILAAGHVAPIVCVAPWVFMP